MKEVKTISWTTKQLMGMNSKGNIKFDSYVQRNKCWDDERKSLLIRTTLNGFPRIPEVYATKETESKSYSFLDGKQRLTTMFAFVNGEFALIDDLEPIQNEDGEEIELAGKTFEELDEVLRDTIMNYQWRVAYYDDLSDEDIAELFFLTNNGKPLSTIEHSRAISPSLKTIQMLGSHSLFNTALTAKAFERYTNEDMVIKAYAMLTTKPPCLDNKVVRPIMEKAVLTEEDIDTLIAVFDRIEQAYQYIIEDEDVPNFKKIAKRLVTRTHMLSVVPLVKKTIDDGIEVEAFAKWVEQFFNGTRGVTNNERYNSRCQSGSGHVEAIKTRLEVIENDFKKFFATYVPEGTEAIIEDADDSDNAEVNGNGDETEEVPTVEVVTESVAVAE